MNSKTQFLVVQSSIWTLHLQILLLNPSSTIARLNSTIKTVSTFWTPFRLKWGWTFHTIKSWQKKNEKNLILRKAMRSHGTHPLAAVRLQNLNAIAWCSLGTNPVLFFIVWFGPFLVLFNHSPSFLVQLSSSTLDSSSWGSIQLLSYFILVSKLWISCGLALFRSFSLIASQ